MLPHRLSTQRSLPLLLLCLLPFALIPQTGEKVSNVTLFLSNVTLLLNISPETTPGVAFTTAQYLLAGDVVATADLNDKGSWQKVDMEKVGCTASLGTYTHALPGFQGACMHMFPAEQLLGNAHLVPGAQFSAFGLTQKHCAQLTLQLKPLSMQYSWLVSGTCKRAAGRQVSGRPCPSMCCTGLAMVEPTPRIKQPVLLGPA